ncbi:MAG: radical SAM protein, partial [Bacteroidaceae bacterium]|nr:radical SAM protein [Bacteroidaceae bacterium]
MRRVCYCNITYKCNNNCQCCISYNVRKGTNRNMGLDDYSFFQKKFSLSANDVWTISGGEPTLNPSFNDIISFCHNYSKHIIVYSNGRTLSTIPKEILSRIERIIVPIYGDEATHNEYVRSSNAYRETIDSMVKVLDYDKNKLDVKILFIDQQKGLKFINSSEWSDIIVNHHFSISRVLKNGQQENCQNICFAASDVIDSLLDINKVVRIYDLPLCKLKSKTSSRILGSVNLT